MPFYTYMLRCADDTYYTGWTTHLEKRLLVHNQGKGAKYTRSRLPVTLAASWAFESETEARRFEYAVKQLKRRQKMALIENSIVISLIKVNGIF
ncbi:MAG: GIY-YIG nuclease family protein [Cyanobacteria bacterium P01_H01_bin.74]